MLLTVLFVFLYFFFLTDGQVASVMDRNMPYHTRSKVVPSTTLVVTSTVEDAFALTQASCINFSKHMFITCLCVFTIV